MMRSVLALWCLAASLLVPAWATAQTPPASPAPPAARPAQIPPATAALPAPSPQTTPPAAPPAGQTATVATVAPEASIAPTQCGLPVPLPAKLPPADSGPVVYTLAPCFERQGGTSVIEPQTYLYYIKLRPSRPSADVWVPYNDEAQRLMVEDFRSLWNTSFLDDLSVEVTDYVFSNGVVGKMVTYHIEERQRVKIVEYVGSKKLEQSKIEEKLRELSITVRLDSFIDPGVVRRVEGVLREMLSEKGYLGATVAHTITPVSGGPKLVNLSFKIDEGPQYKIRDIDFAGNQMVGDGALGRRMKENKEQWFLSFITGRGTYQETKFEEDADRIVEYYRDRGYIAARVGTPEVKVLQDSSDKSQRFIQLKVPIEEGRRYRVGAFDFAGNTVVKSEGLRLLFNKVKQGDYYSEKRIRKGLEKARELYGQGGYFEFTGYPDLKPLDMPETPADGQAPTPEQVETAKQKPPIVDVTMRMQEGKQYFVNRVTFVGNTTTRDNVIRREVRLLENGVFNTEALKYSVKRLNQLGYFKTLEGDAIKVDKSPDFDNRVDVTLKLEEQNRNQLTFGAGVSQYEGLFGQLAFQTSNFMGRGETLSLGVQAGERSKNYQLAFSEPFLFDRPITGGFDVYKREVRYQGQFTQGSTGGNLVFGFPVADFTRAYMGYSYERATVKDINDLYRDPDVIAGNPFLEDALLIGVGGARIISKVQPSIRYDTIDNPIFPTQGKRFSAGLELAGLGGDTNFVKPRLESILMFKQTNRTSLAVRGLVEFVEAYGSTKTLPIFERLYLGGEYSVRGFDLRTIGPRESVSNLVIGGTKSLLFNTEYLISIAGPVRLVLFYDAGQVRDEGQKFAMQEFKTSTGAEVRFFMPVLNVPFRLIFAYNPQRDGVLDNDYQPQKAFTFRFAVGSTF